MAHKIGRNQPCPCGSGRKYKYCHGLRPPETGESPAWPDEALRQWLKDQERTHVDQMPAAAKRGPPRDWHPYCEMSRIEAIRKQEIEQVFAEEFAFVDDCLSWAAVHVALLGDISPDSASDVAMRDVSCDVFDFLYCARKAIAENRPCVVFPLMRRAFEGVGLCNLFMEQPEFVQEWSQGREISNRDVRKALDACSVHPQSTVQPGQVEAMRQEYGYYSRGTHPNREFVMGRLLGQGNRFTLGSIVVPDLYVLGDLMRHLIQLCYWYVGILAWFYHEAIWNRPMDEFTHEFRGLTPRVTQLQNKLTRQLNDLAGDAEMGEEE